jgi:hypothetical protein
VCVLVLVLLGGAKADDASRGMETASTSGSVRVDYSGCGLEEIDQPAFALLVQHWEQVDYFVFYISRDAGMTWQFVATSPRAEHRLNYTAPGEGTYLFAVQTVLLSGRHFPRLISHADPAEVIAVRVKPNKRARP